MRRSCWKRELANPRYEPASMALGTNTDPYQPIEREHRITRSILEVLERTTHPVGIVTKSALITRDIDILARMANAGWRSVAISVTTLDRKIARAMEPRAPTPPKRLDAMRQLAAAGIPTAVMVAPIIPGAQRQRDRAHPRDAREGRRRALGRLRACCACRWRSRSCSASGWRAEFPDRADRVINLMQSMHGGRDYTSEFGVRQRGTGPYAEQIGMRFRLALKRLRLQRGPH